MISLKIQTNVILVINNNFYKYSGHNFIADFFFFDFKIT